MTKVHSHYESLNVTRDAPPEVIRAAYRSLSQKHHPDKNLGNRDAARVMSRLNTAYSVLSDSDQRAQYDLQMLSEQRARDKSNTFQAAVDEGSETVVYTSFTMDETGHASRDASAMPDDKAGTKTGAAHLDTALQHLRNFATRRDVRIVAMVLGGISIALIPISWLIWKENQSMQRLEQAAIYASGTEAAPEPAWPGAAKGQNEAPAPRKSAKAKGAGVSIIDMSGPSGLGADSTELARPAAAPKTQPAAPAAAPAPAAPAATAKASEYERLTAMLKSMGLGLHKLETPAPAPAPAPNAKQPSASAKAAEAAKAPETAKASSAPSSPVQAARTAAASETSRARDEAERPAAPEAARGEAKSLAEASRASAPAASAATASASHAPRSAVVVDARNCALPKYPINAYLNGDSGTVLLGLLVGSDGKVIESKVQKSSGFSELDKAARKALSLCKFKPADGQTEPVWATLTYVWTRD
ncbi:TonB family protein [Oxalobacteraceae bacterium]|nr:TonB family protein [Oxalobacteraceae bacterium]